MLNHHSRKFLQSVLISAMLLTGTVAFALPDDSQSVNDDTALMGPPGLPDRQVEAEDTDEQPTPSLPSAGNGNQDEKQSDDDARSPQSGQTPTEQDTAGAERDSSDNEETFYPKWEFGIGLDIVDHVDSEAYETGWEFHLGKELWQTENFILGVQGHYWGTSNDEISDFDEMNFDALAIYGTARFREIPFLQFKAGMNYGKFQTAFRNGKGSGLAYGAGIVSDLGENWRMHWIDYEVLDIDGQQFTSWSVNFVIVLCIAAAFGGGSC